MLNKLLRRFGAPAGIGGGCAAAGGSMGEGGMSKGVFMAVRVSQDLADRIAADQKQAGEARTSVTMRRLLERGLGSPYLRPAEIDQLTDLLRQFRQLGNNLNQISRALNTHGSLRDYQLEDLNGLAISLSAAGKKARDLIDCSQ